MCGMCEAPLLSYERCVDCGTDVHRVSAYATTPPGEKTIYPLCATCYDARAKRSETGRDEHV